MLWVKFIVFSFLNMEIITNHDSFGIHNYCPILNSSMFLFDLLWLSWCLKFCVLATGICEIKHAGPMILFRNWNNLALQCSLHKGRSFLYVVESLSRWNVFILWLNFKTMERAIKFNFSPFYFQDFMFFEHSNNWKVFHVHVCELDCESIA